MNNPLESGLPKGQEILPLSYRGERYIIPIARNTIQLKTFIATSLMPALSKLETETESQRETGIAFVPYFYETDDFMFKYPKATKALVQHLRAAGLHIADDVLTNPRKLDPIRPDRRCFISYMSEEPDYYYPLDHFNEATFLIGPLSVKPIPRTPGLFDVVDEQNASTFDVKVSIAVHGLTLLADHNLPKWKYDERDRIFYGETVDILKSIFIPHKLR